MILITWFNKTHIVLTSIVVTVVRRWHEWIAQGPRQIRSRPSLADTMGGERDALVVRLTIASVDVEWIPSVAGIFWIVRLSTPLRPRLAFSLLSTPTAVR